MKTDDPLWRTLTQTAKRRRRRRCIQQQYSIVQFPETVFNYICLDNNYLNYFLFVRKLFVLNFYYIYHQYSWSPLYINVPKNLKSSVSAPALSNNHTVHISSSPYIHYMFCLINKCQLHLSMHLLIIGLSFMCECCIPDLSC